MTVKEYYEDMDENDRLFTCEASLKRMLEILSLDWRTYRTVDIIVEIELELEQWRDIL